MFLKLFLLNSFYFLFLYSKENEKVQIFQHPLTNMPPTAEGIETTYYLPKYSSLKFPIGEVITILCHLTNEGDKPYNVTAIMGSLNSPYDFNFHIQNYTYKQIGLVVKPGDEATFEYQFQLHPELQAVDYALAHTIFYDDSRMAFSTTFFNQTVELYHGSGDFTISTLGPLLWALGSTIVIIIISIYLCFPESKVANNIEKVIQKK